jgi:hypothetical protein
MKQARQQEMDQVGSRIILSTYRDQTIQDVVESWNWNLNIFEIFDEIRDWREHDIKNVLTYAYYYFDEDNMINDLHSHLIGGGVQDSE